MQRDYKVVRRCQKGDIQERHSGYASCGQLRHGVTLISSFAKDGVSNFGTPLCEMPAKGAKRCH